MPPSFWLIEHHDYRKGECQMGRCTFPLFLYFLPLLLPHPQSMPRACILEALANPFSVGPPRPSISPGRCDPSRTRI